MKKYLVFFSLITSISAHADLTRAINDACDKPDVVKQIGSDGSCRVIATPQEAPKASCKGKWGPMDCIVNFDPAVKKSEMTLTCYTDPKDAQPFDLEAEGLSYTVSTVIRTSDARDVIKVDPNEYRVYSNDMIVMALTIVNGKKKKITGTVDISLEAGAYVSLSDVTCR